MSSAGSPYGNGQSRGCVAAPLSPGGVPPRSPEATTRAPGYHNPGATPPYSPSHSNTASDDQSEQSYPYFMYPKPNQNGGSAEHQLARTSTPETTSALLAEASQQAAACDGNIAKHQELWLFDQAGRSASQCTEWHNPSGPVPGEPSSVTAALVQAPSSFNNPCKMKKIFRPPFRVKIMATFMTASSSTCQATCYMLSQQQVATLNMWNPEIHGPESMLKGNTLEEQLTSTSGNGGQVVHEMEFTELKFVQPTRMSKRYLLISLQLNPGPTLWLRYTLPTVVVSRSVDQYNKAVLILKDIQPMDGRSLRGMANAAASAAAATDAAVKALKRSSPYTSDDGDITGYYRPSVCRDYLVGKFKEAGFQRAPDENEINCLQLMAGFAPLPDNPGRVAPQQTALSEEQWEVFSSWIEGELIPSLKSIIHLWDKTNPAVICSFAASREETEQFLGRSPAGTFCVRPRLKYGEPVTWVISSCGVSSGHGIQHVLLTPNHLEVHNLDVWVRDLTHLKFCLDIKTEKLVHKEDYFLNGYVRIEGNSTEEQFRSEQVPPSAAAQQPSAPLLGLLSNDPAAQSIPESAIQAILQESAADILDAIADEGLDISSLKAELDDPSMSAGPMLY